ncbi:MAG: alpha/beta hydrolase [Actinomycetota bacterium]|nr:alpha/beta hydrolase [Actinomycetota bacterium]
MTTAHRDYHPDLARAARLLPHGLAGPRSLRIVRVLQAGLTRVQRARGVDVRTLPSGASVRIFGPAGASADAPALVWIHGGGFVLGEAAQDDQLCQRFAEELGAVVVSVDYRLAPEHPFPAALDDCHEALALARDLDGVDPMRVAIGGASAGGGLAAQLALRVKERGETAPVLQLLAYPMLDDRTAADGPSPMESRLRMWNSSSNRFGWSSYLGGAAPEIVAPARREDLAGLAPAWIGAGDLDLFHDEDVAYAKQLRESGVDCDLEVIPGAYHAFDLMQTKAPVSREFFRMQTAALRTAFASPGRDGT